MAKATGNNRNSGWADNPYHVGGERKEYADLPDDRKDMIKAMSKRVAKNMWDNLKDKSVAQTVDGKKIKIEFDHDGVKHVARDAMLTLSGKYMSRKSMVNINHILANASYIRTSHVLSHPRKDERQMWFKYKDNQGRGLYFSIAYTPKREKQYTLYSVTDVEPK